MKTIFRISYTLTFVLASLTGIAFALTMNTEFLIGLLIVLDVFTLALFVNFSNDYFDHVSGADQRRFTSDDKEWEKGAKKIFSGKIYWAGNAFDLGYITRKQGRIVMAILASIAVLISIPIVLHAGWIVIVLGLIAFFVSFFYTAPPLNLGARGFGEIDVFVSFFMMSFFSFYVLVQELSVQMILIASVVGLCVALMRVVDEASGYEAHVKAGEKDVCVRFGLENSVKIIALMFVAVYVLSFLLAAFDYAYLLLFLSLPFAVRTITYLNDTKDEFRFVRPAPEVFKFMFAHQLLIIVSLIVRTVLTSA
ncbi:MAG: prenyltransferase [Methanomassiliicoccales archaeon]|nr:prenyltransferase [Methanomassiliicoccales archaeon]